MNGITIRPATPDDATIVARIFSDGAEFKARHGDTAWRRGERTAQDVEPMLESGHLHLVEQAGVAAAMFLLSWEDDEYWGPQDPVAGYVHRLSVRDGFHGRGLGRRAIDWCADQVRARQRDMLRLDCDPRNAKLCAYYEALGFTRVALRPLPSGYISSLYERAVPR